MFLIHCTFNNRSINNRIIKSYLKTEYCGLRLFHGHFISVRRSKKFIITSRSMNFLTELYFTLFRKKKEEIFVEASAEIDKLPQEILLRILSYLSAKDLVALSSTCRRFTNLINTNDFLPKLTLRLLETRKRSNWVGNRKYRRVFVVSECIDLYFKLPKSFGNHVTNLNLDCWELTVYEIRKAVKLCPHIKELSLMYLVRNRIPEEITEKELIPVTKLDKLSLQGELRIVRCFKDLQVKELKIYRQSDFETCLDEVADFIISQREMFNLELYHMYYISSLFLREEMKHVAFRLDRLIIKYCSHYSFFCFMYFVASQKNSIKFVSVDEFGFDMMKLLMPFTEMKTLRLTLRESYPMDEEDMIVLMVNICRTMFLPQVEDLEIWNYCHNFIHHFPNVKKLKINGEKLDLNMWHCKNLEKLTVITKNLETSMRLSQNLKKLELIMYEYPNDEPPWYYSDCKLESLTVIGAKKLDWIEGFLEHQNTNLKRLRIERCDITEECRELFKKHKDKIESLEVVEQDGMEIEILKRRYL